MYSNVWNSITDSCRIFQHLLLLYNPFQDIALLHVHVRIAEDEKISCSLCLTKVFNMFSLTLVSSSNFRVFTMLSRQAYTKSVFFRQHGSRPIATPATVVVKKTLPFACCSVWFVQSAMTVPLRSVSGMEHICTDCYNRFLFMYIVSTSSIV